VGQDGEKRQGGGDLEDQGRRRYVYSVQLPLFDSHDLRGRGATPHYSSASIKGGGGGGAGLILTQGRKKKKAKEEARGMALTIAGGKKLGARKASNCGSYLGEGGT